MRAISHLDAEGTAPPPRWGKAVTSRQPETAANAKKTELEEKGGITRNQDAATATDI